MITDLNLTLDEVLNYPLPKNKVKRVPKIFKIATKTIYVERVIKLTPSQKAARNKKLVFFAIKNLSNEQIKQLGFKFKTEIKKFISIHDLISDYPRINNVDDFLEFVKREKQQFDNNNDEIYLADNINNELPTITTI